MSLYTRKEGQYVKLTKDQTRRMRRVDDVVALQQAAKSLARTTRALAGWLATVQRKSLRLDAKDLAVTRLPNVERLCELADDVDTAVYILRGK